MKTRIDHELDVEFWQHCVDQARLVELYEVPTFLWYSVDSQGYIKGPYERHGDARRSIKLPRSPEAELIPGHKVIEELNQNIHAQNEIIKTRLRLWKLRLAGYDSHVSMKNHDVD